MKFETEGHICKINDEQVVGNGFHKRTFWVETQDKYPQVLEFQFTGDKCNILDAYMVNQRVLVKFNVRGRVWEPTDGREPRVFHTFNVWRLESLEHPDDIKQMQRERGIESIDEDIPF
tara:strand:- start:183 stop:536 length:354 start_codon:yes stop_codon:yes gene_type:complete